MADSLAGGTATFLPLGQGGVNRGYEQRTQIWGLLTPARHVGRLQRADTMGKHPLHHKTARVTIRFGQRLCQGGDRMRARFAPRNQGLPGSNRLYPAEACDRGQRRLPADGDGVTPLRCLAALLEHGGRFSGVERRIAGLEVELTDKPGRNFMWGILGVQLTA